MPHIQTADTSPTKPFLILKNNEFTQLCVINKIERINFFLDRVEAVTKDKKVFPILRDKIPPFSSEQQWEQFCPDFHISVSESGEHHYKMHFTARGFGGGNDQSVSRERAEKMKDKDLLKTLKKAIRELDEDKGRLCIEFLSHSSVNGSNDFIPIVACIKKIIEIIENFNSGKLNADFKSISEKKLLNLLNLLLEKGAKVDIPEIRTLKERILTADSALVLALVKYTNNPHTFLLVKGETTVLEKYIEMGQLFMAQELLIGTGGKGYELTLWNLSQLERAKKALESRKKVDALEMNKWNQFEELLAERIRQFSSNTSVVSSLSPLDFALDCQEKEQVQRLIESGVDARSGFKRIIDLGWLDIVAVIVSKRKTDLNQPFPSDEAYPLEYICFSASQCDNLTSDQSQLSQYLDLIHRLILANVDINKYVTRPPLYYVVRTACNHANPDWTSLVHLLLKKNADPNSGPLLYFALHYDKENIFDALKIAGADINSIDLVTKETGLQEFCASRGNKWSDTDTEQLRALLKLGANPSTLKPSTIFSLPSDIKFILDPEQRNNAAGSISSAIMRKLSTDAITALSNLQKYKHFEESAKQALKRSFPLSSLIDNNYTDTFVQELSRKLNEQFIHFEPESYSVLIGKLSDLCGECFREVEANAKRKCSLEGLAKV